MPATDLKRATTARLLMEEGFGWRRVAYGRVRLWLKGYVGRASAEALAAEIAAWAVGDDSESVARWLRSLDGHFALVVDAPGWTLAAVDRVRSIPLFFGCTEDGTHLSADAPELVQALGLTRINPTAARAVAMAGYTIGGDTLYEGLGQLQPGQFLLLQGAESPVPDTYHRYEPWRIERAAGSSLEGQLADVTLDILERMVRSAEGRRIVVPLSAGLDSRLIVSGLRHLGHDNVKCFAYGLPGNYEAKASRKIARHLGYEWRFVPMTPPSQRDFFVSAACRAYLHFADSCCSTPVTHELPVIQSLLQTDFVRPGDVVVNGNSGDFISGLHVVPAIRRPRRELSAEQRLDLIVHCLIDKHFRLWSELASTENDAVIRSRLHAEIEAQGLDAADPDTAHGAYEFLEFQDRQSKYVISRQRIYEFADLGWRLPLWDNAYLDFWQSVPIHEKAGQELYRRMLENQDWGGVWRGSGWRFPQRVSPAWIRAPRLALKVAHLPLGAARWHRFERRTLSYWTDLIAGQAMVPYRRTLADRRGARHFVAWHTEAYLSSKGLAYDGRHL